MASRRLLEASSSRAICAIQSKEVQTRIAQTRKLVLVSGDDGRFYWPEETHNFAGQDLTEEFDHRPGFFSNSVNSDPQISTRPEVGFDP